MSKAGAKLSSRLVTNQDPTEKLPTAFRMFSLLHAVIRYVHKVHRYIDEGHPGIMIIQPIVTRASAEAQPLIERLYQLYLYDLSACSEANVDESGLYTAPCFKDYWHNPACAPFLISHESQIIGFALIGGQSCLHAAYNGHTCDALFVLRRFRRQGIGMATAHTLFDCFPGLWEISAYAMNTQGSTFWRATVDRYTQGRYSEVWLQTAAWRGHVQSFTAQKNTHATTE